MDFVLENFSGMRIGADDAKLNDNEASYARNVEFDSGTLASVSLTTDFVSLPTLDLSFGMGLAALPNGPGGSTIVGQPRSDFGTDFPYTPTYIQNYTARLFSQDCDSVTTTLSPPGGQAISIPWQQGVSFCGYPAEDVNFRSNGDWAPTVSLATTVSVSGVSLPGLMRYAVTAIRRIYFGADLNNPGSEPDYLEIESGPKFAQVLVGGGETVRVSVPEINTDRKNVQAVRLYRLYNGEYRRVVELPAASLMAVANPVAPGTAGAGSPGQYIVRRPYNANPVSLVPGDTVVYNPGGGTRVAQLRYVDGSGTIAKYPGFSRGTLSPVKAFINHTDPSDPAALGSEEVPYIYNGGLNSSLWEDLGVDLFGSGGGSYKDDTANEDLGPVLPTMFQLSNGDVLEFEPLPKNWIIVGEYRSSLIAVRSNRVRFSYPGTSWAWPSQYEYSFPEAFATVVSVMDLVWLITSNVAYKLSGQDVGQLSVQSFPWLYPVVTPTYGARQNIAGQAEPFYGIGLFTDKGIIVTDGNQVQRSTDFVTVREVLKGPSPEHWKIDSGDDGYYFFNQVPGETDVGKFQFQVSIPTTLSCYYANEQKGVVEYAFEVDNENGNPRAPISFLNQNGNFVWITDSADGVHSIRVRYPRSEDRLINSIWRSKRFNLNSLSLQNVWEIEFRGRQAVAGDIIFRAWYDFNDPRTQAADFTTTMSLHTGAEELRTVNFPFDDIYTHVVFEVEFSHSLGVSIDMAIVRRSGQQ